MQFLVHKIVYTYLRLYDYSYENSDTFLSTKIPNTFLSDYLIFHSKRKPSYFFNLSRHSKNTNKKNFGRHLLSVL